MNIVVRDFHPDDLTAIEDMILNARNFGSPFLKPEKLRISVYNAFPEFGRILIAYDSESEEIVGYASIQFDWKALVINSIITHHNSLRIGIGKLMVNEIKKIGRAHPIIDVIRVDTGDFMAYAHEFYRSCGFEEVAYVPHYLSWNNHQMIFVYQLRK